MLQECNLLIQPTRIAGKASVCAYYAMTRDNDRDGVVSHGSTHSKRCHVLFSHKLRSFFGKLAIGRSLSIRNFAEELPNDLAKLAALWFKRQFGSRRFLSCIVAVKP